jgi:hypothetical protein
MSLHRLSLPPDLPHSRGASQLWAFNFISTLNGAARIPSILLILSFFPRSDILDA